MSHMYNASPHSQQPQQAAEEAFLLPQPVSAMTLHNPLFLIEIDENIPRPHHPSSLQPLVSGRQSYDGRTLSRVKTLGEQKKGREVLSRVTTDISGSYNARSGIKKKLANESDAAALANVNRDPVGASITHNGPLCALLPTVNASAGVAEYRGVQQGFKRVENQDRERDMQSVGVATMQPFHLLRAATDNLSFSTSALPPNSKVCFATAVTAACDEKGEEGRRRADCAGALFAVQYTDRDAAATATSQKKEDEDKVSAGRVRNISNASSEKSQTKDKDTGTNSSVVEPPASAISFLLRTTAQYSEHCRFNDEVNYASPHEVGEQEQAVLWDACDSVVTKMKWYTARKEVDGVDADTSVSLSSSSTSPPPFCASRRANSTELARFLLPVRRNLFVGHLSLHTFYDLCEAQRCTADVGPVQSEPSVVHRTTTATSMITARPFNNRYFPHNVGEVLLTDATVICTPQSTAEGEELNYAASLPLFSFEAAPDTPSSAKTSHLEMPSTLPSALSSLWRSPRWQRKRGYIRFERAVQERQHWPQFTSNKTTDFHKITEGIAFPISCTAGLSSSLCGGISVRPTPRAVLWSPIKPPSRGRHVAQRDCCCRANRKEEIDDDDDDVEAENNDFDAVVNAAQLWAAEQMCSVDE